MKTRSNPKGTFITVRLDTDTRTRFRQIARQAGQTESGLLRELILLGIESLDKSSQRGSRPSMENSNDVTMRRTTVWMKVRLLEAARQRAKSRGMALSRWIAYLVQAKLFKTPVMTEKEILCLGECNYELAALGRNLNQIARVLNADPTETGKLNRSLIDALQLSVSETREAVRNLVRASHCSWEVEDVGID